MERNNNKYRNKIFDKNNKQISVYNKERNVYEPITFKPPIQSILQKKYNPVIVLTHHTPEARFKQYRKEREDAYHSYDLIIDNIPAGNGGTTHWNEIMTKYNNSNISLVNNHHLQYENMMNVINGKWKTHEELEVIGLYGMTHINPEYIQNDIGIPACFCNLYYTDRILFALKKKGYAPPNWCKELCPHHDNCSHKELFADMWTTTKYAIFEDQKPFLLIPQKAYNSSITEIKGTKKKLNLIDRILTTFDNGNLLYDENLFNYIYSELNITGWQLTAFKEFISRRIIPLDNGLYELWKDLMVLIDCIYNNIILTSISDEVKIKDFKKNILSFCESYSGKDFKKWFDRMMFLMYEHKISTNIKNPLYNLYDIISDIYKHIKREQRLNIQMFGKTNANIDHNTSYYTQGNNFVFGKTNSGQGQNLAYFIDKSDIIRKNIKNAGKFILRSGYQRIEEIFNCIFPDYDDYIVLKSPDTNSYLNRFWRYTGGAYPKYILYQKDFRKYFYNLADLCKEIVDIPFIRQQKILLIIFKQGIKELKKKRYFPPEKYPNISYEYWYNIEGKNAYSDCTGLFLFGCAGKPNKIEKTLANMFNMPLELKLNHSINGESSQGVGRLRANMYPDLKWCIDLSKVLPNGITNYINFNKSEDIGLFSYMTNKKNVKIEDILKDVYLNEIKENTLLRKLGSLCKSGLLNRERNGIKEKFTYSLI